MICIPFVALARPIDSKEIMSVLNAPIVQLEIRKLELKFDFGPLSSDDIERKMYGRQFVSITIKKGGTLESFPPIEGYSVEALRRDGELCTLSVNQFADGRIEFRWSQCEMTDQSSW